jgi:sulfofructose kinase
MESATTNELKSDVLGFGAVAVDDLVYVDAYPPADAKLSVLRSERQCGGLTATALVAASRLGSKCAYAGVLGTDDLSSYAVERMRSEGIDLSHLRRRSAARTIHSFIVVDTTKNTRNIFANHIDFVGADPDWPEADVIRSAGVVFVDHFGLPGMIRAARLAREANIPVVADIERANGKDYLELFSLADHLILSESVVRQLTGTMDPATAARLLWSDDRKAVVITCGAEGCWYLANEHYGAALHQKAFPVQIADTTGCGDVFHGAYASALARGAGLTECVRFASAAAALKATQIGGQAGIPDRDTVEAFLRQNNS